MIGGEQLRQWADVSGSARVYQAGRDVIMGPVSFDVASDAAALKAQTASDAADELIEWVGDPVEQEGHRRAVKALDAISPGVATRVLMVVLRLDEDLAVSLIAHLNGNRRREIVNEVSSIIPWLEDLPAAAEVVHQYRIDNREDLGGVLKRFARAAPSMRGTQGFYQVHDNGVIVWSRKGGVQSVRDDINSCYDSLSGTGGRLGFPLSEEIEAGTSPSGTIGWLQCFEGSIDYDQSIHDRDAGIQSTGAIFWSQEYGPHAVWGRIGDLYELSGSMNGFLGCPVAGETEVTASKGTKGWSQFFEGGAIYRIQGQGAIAVDWDMAEYHEDHGGAEGFYGFPVGPVRSGLSSEYETTGKCQPFETALPYLPVISDRWDDIQAPFGGVIYHSDKCGAHGVSGDIGLHYEELGGPASWLGFPTEDAEFREADANGGGYGYQEFEGGGIIWTAQYGAVAVPGLILGAAEQEELGYPVSSEQRFGTGGADRIQFFEEGVVTVRDGVAEAWLSPVEVDKEKEGIPISLTLRYVP
jgi:uncharacterized protein with LGFP repeats